MVGPIVGSRRRRVPSGIRSTLFHFSTFPLFQLLPSHTLTVSFVERQRARGPGSRLAMLLFVSLLSSPAVAAAQVTSGAISGVITDAQSAVLPGVALTLRNTETGFTRTTVTEADGRYRLAGLPPGRYELKAELSGFAPVEVTDITLTIGLDLGLNIALQLGGVAGIADGHGPGAPSSRQQGPMCRE